MQDRSDFQRPEAAVCGVGMALFGVNCTKNAGQIVVPRGNLLAALSFLLFIVHSSLIEIRYFCRLKIPK